MGQPSSIHPFRAERLLVWMALVLLSVPSVRAQTITATAAPLILPSAVVIDSAGNLYIAETGNHTVRKVDPQGNITTVAGSGTQGFSGDGGVAVQAQLDSPQGLAVGANTLYIADTHNHRVRALNLAANTITTVAGSGTEGFAGDGGAATQARLNLPTALALDSKGNLYLADTANHRIRRIDASTGMVTTVVGTGTQGYSGDNGAALSARIDSPTGLAMDAAGNLYLADTRNHRIRKVDAASGIVTTIAGTGVAGRGAAQLDLPQELSVDAAGTLYLADSANHRILRIDSSSGAVSTVAGSGTQGYSGDAGPATAARLDSPRSVSVDATGQTAFADTHNQRVRRVDAQTIVTAAGVGTPSPSSSLTLSAPGVVAYGTGQLTAALSASTPASGSVVLLDTFGSVTTSLATLALSGNGASFSLKSLPAGSHTLSATYAGDATHGSAQSSVFVLMVTPASTVTTLSLSSTTVQPIMVSAQVVSTILGTPTGTVTLLQGTTPVGTATLAAGAASAVLPTLGSGTYSLSVSYAGDNNFQPSVSGLTALTIAPVASATPDFTLTAASPAAQTIPAGATATYSFATQTIGTLSSPITLAASGLPFGATASFNPSYLPPGSITNAFTLTVTTLKPAIKAALLWPVALGMFLGTLLQRGKSWLDRVRPVQLLVLLVSVSMVFGMTACGDRISIANPRATTQPATYTITVTGTATSPAGAVLVHSAAVTLTLQ